MRRGVVICADQWWVIVMIAWVWRGLTNWRHLNVWVGPFLNSCWDPFLTNFVAFFWTFFWTFFGCFDSTCRKLDSHEENVSKQYCFNTFFQVMQKIIWKIKKWIVKNQNNGLLKTRNRPLKNPSQIIKNGPTPARDRTV